MAKRRSNHKGAKACSNCRFRFNCKYKFHFENKIINDCPEYSREK